MDCFDRHTPLNMINHHPFQALQVLLLLSSNQVNALQVKFKLRGNRITEKEVDFCYVMAL